MRYIGPPRSFGHTSYAKRGIVIHSTEGTGTAEGEARYAMRRTDGTSSHYYVDGKEVIQSLSVKFGANHVGSTYGNTQLISYEFCGRASWSTTKWMTSIDWKEAAAAIAANCKTYSIPARRGSVSQLRSHDKGIYTHNDCRLALGGTDHTDPGSAFPVKHLLTLVNEILTPEEDDDMTPKDMAQADVFPAPSKWLETHPPKDADDATWNLGTYLKSLKDQLDRLEARLDKE